VAKVELGNKRQCPKCGTRFYDLGNDDPITCIECEETFVPEVLLKPRRPVPVTEKAAAPEKKKKEETEESSEELLEKAGNDDLLEDEDEDEDIEGILEVQDESIKEELSAEVVINTDVGGSDEK
jgi:uncharacterized protein (TIGR02300 family)